MKQNHVYKRTNVELTISIKRFIKLYGVKVTLAHVSDVVKDTCNLSTENAEILHSAIVEALESMSKEGHS